MIRNPKDMPEIQKLRKRIMRLYGMSRISAEQHNQALAELTALEETLKVRPNETNHNMEVV